MAAPAPIGFDKMRAMLARAADLRADEQRQVVDLIDEVRIRLTPIEGFVEDGRGRIASTQDTVAVIRERLTELPDRTEVSVIAERLDETLARIDSQDAVLATIATSLAALSDRVGRPLEAIEARLDGVVGRFEGVSGRLDGLDDRLQHLHARLDELDSTVGSVSTAVGELPGQLDPMSVHRRFDELTGSVHQRFDDEFVRLDALAGRPAVDPTAMIDGLSSKLEAVGGRIDNVGSRVKAVEESVRNNAGNLAGSLEQGLDKLNGAVGSRPDRDEFGRTLSKSQHESERRITQQLDGALADFAEVMLGQSVTAKPVPARAAARKSGRKAADDD